MATTIVKTEKLSGKRIRRKDWYYRDGKYFANKQCYRLYVTQELEKAQKEKERFTQISCETVVKTSNEANTAIDTGMRKFRLSCSGVVFRQATMGPIPVRRRSPTRRSPG